MPTRDKDPNCNNKKAHIGNDYVTIVYNDSCDTYSMGTIKVRTPTDGASKVRTRTNYVVKVRTRADGNDGAIKVVRTRTGRVINVRVRTRTTICHKF